MFNIKFILLFIPLALSGCATSPPTHQTIQATIINNSGDAIQNIFYQPCNSDQAVWTPLLDSPLASQKVFTFPLTEPCINLKAINMKQKSIAQQSAIKSSYPFLWQIK